MTRPPLLLAWAAFAVATVAVAAAAPGAAPVGLLASDGHPPTAPYAGEARAGPDTAGVLRRGVASGAEAGGAAGVRAGVRAGVLAAARSAPAAMDERARWRWPLVPRPLVLRPFRAPVSEYGPGHRGLDLAALVGAPVLAVESGVVTHAGVVAGRGTVTVRHAGGLSSTYEPVTPAVGLGDLLRVGDRLGSIEARAGPRHCGVRACLHLGARRGDVYLDPHPLFVAGRVRLLPLD